MQPDTTESCTKNRQHVDVQEQYNADNADEPVVDPNQMVMGNINNRKKGLFPVQ